ncbi:MAG: asparagine synthase (glutamine-hydrolyzing) [Planctomycetaceae bacterium]
MCGIAGVIDLRGRRSVDHDMLSRMAAAIHHRGPDESGYAIEPGIGLASRRLSIVDIESGQQPVTNEDGSVIAVFNGELFEHADLRSSLESSGHQFRSQCDSEVLVHLWERDGEKMFTHLKGQFAFALYDARTQVVILARDRVGICPLHWAQVDDQIYFGSEIKAILASGQVTAAADPRGLDNIFSMFAVPGRRTPFRGVSSVLPANFLKIQIGRNGSTGTFQEHSYWDLDFPDRGDEWQPARDADVVEGFEDVFHRAVERRLQADVPVVGYLSGGVDSATVMAVASRIQNKPLHGFSISIDSPFFNESQAARRNAQAIGCQQTMITCSPQRLLDNYGHLIWAAENPVVDTSSSALDLLAREVHDQGYKVTLTGEGADEALGGYPWFKANRLLNCLDRGSFRPSQITRRIISRLTAPNTTHRDQKRIQVALGGPVASADLYGMMQSTRHTFYSSSFIDRLEDSMPFEELQLDRKRMQRWDPLNQSLYVGYKTHLPGLLLNHKSDRVAMANSVEARYPFLDEEVIDFCAKLPVKWKLSGILRDKVVLRRMAEKLLPSQVARTPKKMFRAPTGGMLFESTSGCASQLLSRESLRRTGYFDPDAVLQALARRGQRLRIPGRKCFEEMGLVAVYGTQLWHHTFVDNQLCELPVPVSRPRKSDAALNQRRHPLTHNP